MGTRGSQLALTQSTQLVDTLRTAHPDETFDLKIITTKGDRIQHIALDKIGDKGLFTKELEHALISGEIDMAIHSMKDMPSQLPDGLTLAAPSKREDPADVLLTPHPITSLLDLPKNARIATGSKRRAFQLKALRPDAIIEGIRGNVDTRIRKMHDLGYDGILLAAAGLKRLGIYDSPDYHRIRLEPRTFIPATCQGVLAVEIREGDGKIRHLLEGITDPLAQRQMKAERAFLETLNGTCHLPMGAYLHIDGETSTLYGLYGNEEKIVIDSITGTSGDEREMGIALAKQLKAKLSPIKKGIVYLTGGGCGDPGLLTLKAYEALGRCDALVYDALVSDALLHHVPSTCEKIYVGKRAKNHALPQEEINRLLVQLANDGKTVVRLKGGDPYVFGRGGEEGEALYDAGIPFEVIPGITSVIGGLAYAGIPITHRDCASSFQVVTGHLKDDTSDLDWPTLAKTTGTLVFLMGISNLKTIANALIANGMAATTPAALVHRASTPYQRVVAGELRELYALAQTHHITAPSLIVIGDVVLKRESLRFYDRLPLFGKSVVVTRSRTQSSEMAKRISELGGIPILFPTITIAPIPDGIERLKRALTSQSTYSHLVLTSVNAVMLLFETLSHLGKDARALANLHISAIGSATATHLANRGIKPDFIPKSYVGEALVEGLKPTLTKESHILLPHSKNARPMMAEALKKVCALEEIFIYETLRAENPDYDLRQALTEHSIDAITFTSSTTVSYFLDILGSAATPLLANCTCASIGPETSKKMRELGISVDVEATTYTIDGLLEALLEKEGQSCYPPDFENQ